MNMVKKFILGLGILATMVMAFVVGVMSDGFSKPLFSRNGVESGATDVLAKAKKPITYTYKAGEVAVQKGGNTINFNYSPTSSQQDGTKAVAYEYVFGNTLNKKTGVNLKEIDTTDVTVSYAWSPTRLDTDEDITTYADYQLQSLENDGSKVYIYIFVSPNEGVENIPVTFTRSVVWYYGVPTTMSIINVKTNEKTDHEIVVGQEIDAKYMEDVEVPEGKEIRYYLDQKQTILATFPYNNIAGTNLYYRVASIPNLPSDWIGWNSTLKTYYVKKGTSTLPADLVIPEEHTTTKYGTHPVTYIYNPSSQSNGVFYNKTTLTSVELPSTLTSIGGYAFMNCSSLTSADLSNCTQLASIETQAFSGCKALISADLSGCTQLTSMGNNAFSSCSALTSVDLSNCSQLTTIGTYVFSSCSALTSIDLSGCTKLTTIGSNAFYFCFKLTAVYISDIVSWCNIGFVDYSANPLYFAKNLYLNNGPISITASDNITQIKPYAFYNCATLTSVTLHNNMSNIGEQAFSNCSALTSIDLSGCTQLTTIKPYAFSGCSALTSVDLSNCTQLTSMGNNAFSSCSALTSIDLSGCTKLTTIGSNAFNACSKLTGVYISDVEEWCNIDFAGNASNPLYYAKNLYLNNELATSITIPNSVAELKPYVFYNCTSINSVRIPASITSIGTSAFNACSKLTGVYISDIASWCNIDFADSTSNPLLYAKNIYLNNELVTNLIIPSSVTELKPYVFYHCGSLTSVTIPASITSIGGYAFYNCSSLTSADLSNCTQLASIETQAFYNCEALTSVDLSNCSGLTSIEAFTFYNCSALTGVYIRDIEVWCNIDFGSDTANPLRYAKNLYLNNELVTSVVIPSSVTKVKPYVFYNCKSLTSVTIPASVTSIGQSAFSGCSALTSISIPSSVTAIGSGAFSGCSALTSISIPSSVSAIGNGAFSNCTSLTSIDFGENSQLSIAGDSPGTSNPFYGTGLIYDEINGGYYLSNGVNPYFMLIGTTDNTITEFTVHADTQVIYHRAFYKHTSLASVNLSACTNLKGISFGAFDGCSSLTSITIPSSVTNIAGRAFAECTSLTSVTFSENSQLESIGSNAFNGCTGLMEINLSNCAQLTSIGTNAFYGCSKLTSITIPASVTSIGSNAFYNCSALTSITFEVNEGEDLTNLWYRTTNSTDWANKENGTVTNLSTPTSNDNYFKSSYYQYYWYKVCN